MTTKGCGGQLGLASAAERAGSLSVHLMTVRTGAAASSAGAAEEVGFCAEALAALEAAAAAAAAAAWAVRFARSCLKAAAVAYGRPESGSRYLAGKPVIAHTARFVGLGGLVRSGGGNRLTCVNSMVVMSLVDTYRTLGPVYTCVRSHRSEPPSVSRGT